MSELAKSSRKAMKSKAHRLTTGDPHAKVDASSWTPSEPLDTTAKTGARPVMGRRFKRGGKVHGEETKHHAGRKPRKSGGSAKATPDNLQNRNMVEANEDRAGTKHIGAFKHGGKAHKHHKAAGGPTVPGGPSALDTVKRPFVGNFKKGGRAHKYWGGDVDPSLVKKAMKGSSKEGMDPHNSVDKQSHKYKELFDRKTKYAAEKAAKNAPESDLNMLKRGGKAMKHDDTAEDTKLIKKLIKPTAMKHGMAHKSSGGSNLGPHPEFDKLSDAGIKETHSYWHARKSQADSDNVKHPEAERNLSLLQEEKKSAA